jgi:hypothetical protein
MGNLKKKRVRNKLSVIQKMTLSAKKYKNMFTGIIEATGEVKRIEKEGTNVHFTLSCPFTQELKIDQSLAHNGCCLTVVKISVKNTP